ncbi:MAG TPA: hypothetical protein VGC11_13035 [Acidimicrobiia bacterium]
MDLDRHRRLEAALWASFGASPVERYVDVGPSRVHHRVQELGAGPPLLFVHGSSITGTCFAPLVAQLDDHRCLLPVAQIPGAHLQVLAGAEHAPWIDDVDRVAGFVRAPLGETGPR